MKEGAHTKKLGIRYELHGFAGLDIIIQPGFAVRTAKPGCIIISRPAKP